jgi:hypothetical protein
VRIRFFIDVEVSVNSSINAVLVFVLLLNLFLLGTSRIRALIHGAALQGVLLSVMPLLVQKHFGMLPLFIAIATLLLKGSAMPRSKERSSRSSGWCRPCCSELWARQYPSHLRPTLPLPRNMPTH